MKSMTQTLIAGLFIAVAAVSCTSEKPDHATQAQPAETPALATIWQAQQPPGAVPVSTVKGVTPGTAVTVEGVIGGIDHPFSDSFAVFVVTDDAIVYCNEMDDDHCATPWDACCEDPDKIKASRATIQFVSEDGFPLQQSIKGNNNLKELDLVIVTGVVAPSSTPENLIINATGIYRKQVEA